MCNLCWLVFRIEQMRDSPPCPYVCRKFVQCQVDGHQISLLDHKYISNFVQRLNPYVFLFLYDCNLTDSKMSTCRLHVHMYVCAYHMTCNGMQITYTEGCMYIRLFIYRTNVCMCIGRKIIFYYHWGNTYLYMYKYVHMYIHTYKVNSSIYSDKPTHINVLGLATNVLF